MESLEDLLDFASDIGEEDDDVDNDSNNRTKSLKSAPFSLHSSRGAKNSGIVEEEELEWISNKDAFPKFESFVDIIPNNLNNNKFNQSPVSVLENITNSNNNFKVPVRARSKTTRKKRREQWQDYSGWGTSGNKRSRAGGGGGAAANDKPMESDSSSAVFGRKCQHCQTEKTPQWRAGPTGPKTLCNACGVRYKSGRLVPEYRPASSPTFSTELHSNSHRKVLEMRRQKQMGS